MDTFPPNWVPLVNATGTDTFSVATAQFGDGYVQEAARGIHPALASWSLSWLGTADPPAIRAWLRAHVGQRFVWTPPDGAQGQFACPGGCTITAVGGGVYQLTATFVERATP